MQTDKLLRAFIEASGFEIEEVKEGVVITGDASSLLGEPCTSTSTIKRVDYKVTKRGYGDLNHVLAVIGLLEGTKMSRHEKKEFDKAVIILNRILSNEKT